MYPTLDVQTTLTFARLHQDDVRVAFPRRRLVSTWLRRRSHEPTVEPRTLAPPAQHHPAAA
jgi:hypothetical protein